MIDPDTMTLGEARDKLAEGLEEGTDCPCCGRYARKYRWSLYSTAINALSLFYLLGDTTEFVHQSEIKALGYKGTGDVARLRPWGLVESDGEHRDDGGRSGNWRVTKLGERFLKGEAKVPKHMWIFGGEKYEVDPNTSYITVHEAMRKQFDLREVLQSI